MAILHERLSISRNHPIIARFFDYKRFTYPWHFHMEYEIIYTREGTGERYVADSTELFYPGDMVLLGTNVPHYMKSSQEYYGNDNNLRVKGVVIQFEKDFMSHAINNYADLVEIRMLLEDAQRGIQFPYPANKQMIEMINHLPDYKGIGRITGLLSLLNEMAHFKQKRLLGSMYFRNTLSRFTDNRLEKVFSYITFHYNKAINLNEVASMAAMNTSAFCRFFKEKSGKTFMEYVMDMRIEYACKLLIGNSMNISHIAVECGFNTISHFNKIFKRSKGITPLEYRKKYSSELGPPYEAAGSVR